jgi:hypothetical protein
MPRMKVVEIDGAKFTISPLTVKQVEDFIGQSKEQRTELFGALLPARMYDVIVVALANASPGDGWTRERVYTELDQLSLETLFGEILEFSRMKLEKKAVDDSAGEALPAALTSPESDATLPNHSVTN